MVDSGSSEFPLTLILMRHAKSDWSDSSTPDHDRTLNKRGRQDSPRMAHWLSDQGVRPTKILCSSAQRTRETVGLMCEFWQDEINVTYNESLYLASPESIFQTICTEGERAERLMVVAHNPGMSQLSSAMANTSIEMPTAAVAVFQGRRRQVVGIWFPDPAEASANHATESVELIPVQRH